jgi:hypothetical protein
MRPGFAATFTVDCEDFPNSSAKEASVPNKTKAHDKQSPEEKPLL